MVEGHADRTILVTFWLRPRALRLPILGRFRHQQDLPDREIRPQNGCSKSLAVPKFFCPIFPVFTPCPKLPPRPEKSEKPLAGIGSAEPTVRATSHPLGVGSPCRRREPIKGRYGEGARNAGGLVRMGPGASASVGNHSGSEVGSGSGALGAGASLIVRVRPYRCGTRLSYSRNRPGIRVRQSDNRAIGQDRRSRLRREPAWFCVHQRRLTARPRKKPVSGWNAVRSSPENTSQRVRIPEAVSVGKIKFTRNLRVV